MKTNRNLSHNHLALLTRLGRHLRRFRPHQNIGRRSAGQGLVEFALILPFLLLLLLGIIEFSYVFAAYTSLFNAAREGVRHGAVQPMDQVGIILSAREKIFIVDPVAADITIAYDDGPSTTIFTDTEQLKVGQSRVLINVVYDLPTITPVIHPLWPEFHVEMQAARTVASLGNIEAAMPPGWGFPPGPPGEGEGGEGGGAAIFLSIEAPQMVHSGDAVQFTYTVENTGDVDLTNVTIVDGLGPGHVINAGNLAVGATTVETVTETLFTTITDQAVTVTGFDNGEPVSYSANVTVMVINPALELTVEVDPDPAVVSSGEEVTFTYTVQNTGDVGLTNVDVVDSLDPPSIITSVDLLAGESVFWKVSRLFYATKINSIIATGTDPLGLVVDGSDSVEVQVQVVTVPIVITEPLNEGDTVVMGTAQAGQTVYIRDLMDGSFPAPASDSTVVQGDGTFEFAGLPNLVAGHVIQVQGYGEFDTSVVQGINLAPITISTPLCHGSTVITGTAEPNREVELLIADLGYQGSTTTDAAGSFAFTLFGGLTLQVDQAVVVNGYGETSGDVYVEWCGGINPYIVIDPQCGAAVPNTTITVDGYNWGSEKKQIKIFWDDDADPKATVDLNNPEKTFSDEPIVVDVPALGEYAIRAELWVKSGGNYVYTGDFAEATFVSPCPAPNLVITNLELLTTEPISTHQQLDFSVTVENTGTVPVNNLFWIDLYADEVPVLGSPGIAWGAVSALSVGDSTTLTITLQSGFEVTGTYQIWALADSREQVSELDEEDNDHGPISVPVTVDGTPPETPAEGSGAIEGETWVSLAGFPLPHERAEVWCVNELGKVVASTTSDSNAQYMLNDLPAGTYTVMAETWIDGVRYFGSVPNIAVSEGETAVAIIIMYR